MEDLVLKSEKLAWEAASLAGWDIEMPRLKRNFSQIIEVGNQLYNRTVGASANREEAEMRVSVLLGTRGYDYQKVSRRLDGLVSRVKKNYVTSNQIAQPMRETDIQGFVKSEREHAILLVYEEIERVNNEQISKQYWHTVTRDWDEKKLDFLNSISAFKTDDTDLVAPEPVQTSNADAQVSKLDMDSSEYITKVAQDYENRGQYEEAVKLYDSISEYGKVLEILTKLLGEVLPGGRIEQSERDKVENLALEIANRYCEPQVNPPREIAGNFYLLMDLMTFFNYYHANQYREALDTIQKLKILPQTQGEVEFKSREFNRYPEEIRRNISDILLATMNILYYTYKEQPSPDLKQKAEAVITFSGMIQYKMPSDAIARLIQLEVLIN